MYQIKTKINDNDVLKYIEKFDIKRHDDIYKLLDIYTKVSGSSPKMFGNSIIGFGSYHYKYASGHEGIAPIISFAPRKNNITIYCAVGDPIREEYLTKLGKHKSSVGCIYINKLSDINIDVLESLIKHSYEYITNLYPIFQYILKHHYHLF